MKTTFTRERLQEITEDGFLKHGESKELARIVLAAMEQEPKYWLSMHRFQSYLKFNKADAERDVAENGGLHIVPLYTAPQSAPVVPDGYCIMPMKLTADNGAKGALSGEFSETKFINCPECFGDDECETCDGSGRIEITVPVTWTTIKAVWAKGVEHFAAAPQQDKSHG